MSEKLPAFQFYTGDWLKDPNLSMCSPSTRGIWMDLLCAMHELNRSGQITGTAEQLSRICRCTSVQLEQALKELESTCTAGVIGRENTFTVINRRMKRQSDIAKSRRDAGKSGMEKRWHNKTITEPPSSSSSSSSTSVKEKERVKKKKFKPPTLEEIQKYIAENPELDNVDVQTFWKGFNDSGWIDTRGNPVRNWKLKLRTWSNFGHERKNGANRHPANVRVNEAGFR